MKSAENKSAKKDKTLADKEEEKKKIQSEKAEDAEKIKKGNPVTKKVKEKLPPKKNLGPSGQEWDI